MPQLQFLLFYLFLGSVFFERNFPYPFIVYSMRSCFVWINFPFLVGDFLFTWGILTLIFNYFDLFLLNSFPNSFRVCFWSSFLFNRRKFFELYVRPFPAMALNSSSQSMILRISLRGIGLWNWSDFHCFAVKICVRDVNCSALRSIVWLTSLKKVTCDLF